MRSCSSWTFEHERLRPTRDESLRRYSSSKPRWSARIEVFRTDRIPLLDGEPVSQRLGTVRAVRPRTVLARLVAGNATNVAFSDAQKLMVALGFDELRVRGSHHVYGRPGIPEQLNLQDRDGQAKPYQLRQLVALVRQYDLKIEEDVK